MAHSLEDIIKGILSSDGSRVKDAEAQLYEAYKDPNSLYALCQIMTSNSLVEVRQLATILLDRRIQPVANWEMIPEEQRKVIKCGMMRALVEEKERIVRNAIGSLVNTIIRHDAGRDDNWLDEVMKYIYEHCSLLDEVECELGSGTFASLAGSAPIQFMSQIESICQLFVNVLTNASMQKKLPTKTIYNMCSGMTNLIPFTLGNKAAESIIIKELPLLMKLAKTFAHGNKFDEFNSIFEIFDCIAEYVPRLFNDVGTLMNFSLEILSNLQIDKTMRIQIVSFIGSIIHVKKTKIIKLDLTVNIITVIFEMMCYTSDINDAEESELFTDSAVSAAMQTLDQICSTLPRDKCLPPLLQLIEAALQHPDPLRRRSAYLSMGVICEGCISIICEKYLDTMLSVIKTGLTDPESIVRISAYYALAQFVHYLQPDISEHTLEILKIFFDFLHQLVMDVNMGNPEPKNMCRMFQALQVHCECLEDKILEYLPMLMECLFETMNPNNTISLRELSLITIGSASISAKKHMGIYLPRILAILGMYMVNDCNLEIEILRCQAIHTWSVIVRHVGKTNILPFTNDSMRYCLMILSGDPIDPDLRRAIYNLLGALSKVLKENMSSVFPKIMDRMVLSVISHQDVPPSSSMNDDDMDNDEDDDDDDDFYDEIECDYALEKQMAINILREFSATAGKAFAPYLQASFDNVYKIICHPREATRRGAIEALCEFVMGFHRLGDGMSVTRTCSILMPKFTEMLLIDDSIPVVNRLLEDMSALFKELHEDAVPTPLIREQIFRSIKKLLAVKSRCQWAGIFCGRGGASASETGGDEEEDSDLEEEIIENTVDLFNAFGYAVEPGQYSIYFGKVLGLLGSTLSETKLNMSSTRKSLILGTLSDSLRHLGSFVDNYFDILCPIFVNGSLDEDSLVRQNCYYGLGELILQGEKKSLEYCPFILRTLSDAISKETDPAGIDYICGAVARLLLDNYRAFELKNVLPVFLSQLPLRSEFHENDVILQMFHLLYEKSRASIFQFLEQMLTITIQILLQNQLSDEETTDSAIDFIKMIRQQYPEQVQTICSVNPEIYNFVMSL